MRRQFVSSKIHNEGVVSQLRGRAFKNSMVQYKWPIIALTIFLSLSANCLMLQSWHLAESNHKIPWRNSQLLPISPTCCLEQNMWEHSMMEGR